MQMDFDGPKAVLNSSLELVKDHGTLLVVPHNEGEAAAGDSPFSSGVRVAPEVAG